MKPAELIQCRRDRLETDAFMELPKLLTLKETAEYLGIKVGTLYNWVNQKRIEYVKIGRLVRFEPEGIKRFIEENRVKPLEDRMVYGKRSVR